METDVLALDFTFKGYLIMFSILAFAGFYGACLAYRQKRNVIFWFVLCTCVPMCLFFLAGCHSQEEDRKTKAEREAYLAEQEALKADQTTSQASQQVDPK
ncbi:MAG: hypothetical protein R3Y11_12210 [Pseudomonadota bacterium]